MGDHGLHNWWYACLVRAGIVAPGTTSGERMHKARHTAGQRVLDATGNLKPPRSCSGMPRFRHRRRVRGVGQSNNSRTRCGPSWRAKTESFPPSLTKLRQIAIYGGDGFDRREDPRTRAIIRRPCAPSATYRLRRVAASPSCRRPASAAREPLPPTDDRRST